MNIVLTHAYFLNEDSKEQRVNKPYPPLGLLYLSAWLDQHQHPNEVYDSTFFSSAEQRRFLAKRQPDIIAIYVNLMTKLNVIDLVRYIRQDPLFGECLIVLGGPDITYNVEEYLSFGADILVIGEGEQSLLEILHSTTQADKNRASIAGIAFRDSQGKVVRTPKRSHLKNIDELPMPNRKKINLSLYLDYWKKHHGVSSISISTQRGCPYTCRWCSTAVYGQSYRRRSPEKVVQEIVQLQNDYDFDQIWFVDDVFTVSHKWMHEFREQLQLHALKIAFECITRADRLNHEILNVLKEAGCMRVWIGAESGSQTVLDAMDRRVDVHQVSEMILVARKLGIEAGTFIMLGYIGETERDIQKTLTHLRESNPHHVTITVAYPIKGTALYHDVQDRLIQTMDWHSSTDREVEFKRTYVRPYYDYAVRWVMNGLKFHQSQLQGQYFRMQTVRYGLKMMLARAGMFFYRFTHKN